MKTNLFTPIRNDGRFITLALTSIFSLTSVNALAQLNEPGVLPYAESPAAAEEFLDPLLAFPDGLTALSSASTGALYSVDTTNGAATPLVNTNGSSSFVGLTFLAGTLYGSDLINYPGGTGGFDVGSIDDTGTISFLSNQNGSSNWHGLASGEAEGRMWSIDINNGNSLTEQFPDGTVNVVGSSSIQGRGMAYDDGNGILYATGGNGLYTVNTATGESTLVGPMDISTDGYAGLAFDECSGILYMTAGNSTSLYTLDTSTGSASLVGPTGSTQLDGLAWNGTCEQFDKVIVAGNDVDGVGGIDLAVEVGIETPASYDFTINYNQPDLPPVQIEDTVPAEWRVSGLVDDSLNCEVAQANKGKKDDKSATKLVCLPDSTQGSVTVLADARCHDSRNNKKCKPTSCGALYLNNGAAAYEIDPDTGEPVVDDEGNRLPPLVETNSLCLVAVSDLNGGGIDYSGNGDEDGDGLLDHEEACGIGTDPCVGDSDGDGVSDFDEVASGCMDPLNPDTDGDTISDGDELAAGTDPCSADTDGDGYDDNVDNCPLEGPADPALGEILGEDGCLRQSQCSDGLDNEPDGNTDFPDDASCDDILDDSEDTVDVADCSNGAVQLSIAPGGQAMVCDDPTNSTCEQDVETLCPANWHLCPVDTHNSRNDGWNYPVGNGINVVVGEIHCRTFGGAGHFTLGPYDGVTNLGEDTVNNCGYGSSRPSCTASYGCNETFVQALCCAPNPLCGNGVVDSPEEECDDGNSDETDACLNSCSLRTPANGIGCG